jgi:hypothetical protein
MIKEEISFRCPLCSQNFSAKGVKHHIKNNHPEINKAEFIILLKKSENSGTRVVEKKRVAIPGAPSPFKTVFNSSILNESKFPRIVLGGAIGLGKK